MILPDLNLLLYAYNPHAPQHAKAAAWWKAALEGDELVGIPNEVCLGFVRFATNARLGAASVPLADARSVVNEWLSLPHIRVLTPSANHFDQVMNLVAATHGSGALISDAVLAAYAIQYRATLHSNDGDFSRFPGLSWKNPLLS